MNAKDKKLIAILLASMVVACTNETPVAQQEAYEADIATDIASQEMEEGMEATTSVIGEGAEYTMASVGETAGEAKVAAEEVGAEILEATEPAATAYQQAKIIERNENQVEEINEEY